MIRCGKYSIKKSIWENQHLCILGMYSKTMWNKQRYCWTLQNHVWIQNFRRSNWKITILGKSSFFFRVLRYGRSCREMCGTILRVGKQDDSTTLQRIYSMHWWPSFQRRRIQIRRRMSKVCSQIVQKCSYLGRIGRPDILWSVNKLARSITKWTKACDQRLCRLVSYIHHTCVNRNSIAMWETLPNSAGWDCFKTPILREILRTQNLLRVEHCVFGSQTFVPISWMCKKQTSVSHSSTGSEIISLDATLRLDGIPTLDLWDLIVAVLGNTNQRHKEQGDLFKKQTWSSFNTSHNSKTKAVSESDWWFG